MSANFLKRISLATVLASAALALAGAAWLRSAPRSSTVASGSADRGVADASVPALQAQVATLRNELNMLRVAIARSSAVAQHAMPIADPSLADKTTEPPAVKPAMVSNDAPKGVTITESTPGAWSVRNTDPAMAGQVKVVTVQRADGTTEMVSIVVPEAER